MATKLTSSLIFMREVETRQNRSLERRGDEWFEDGRTRPHHTAAYLDRLRRLRKDLNLLEHETSEHDVERFTGEPTSPRGLFKANNKTKSDPHVPTYPERYGILQKEKQYMLDRRRRGTKDTSIYMDPIQGEKLSGSRDFLGDVSVASVPGRSRKQKQPREIREVVDYQRARLALQSKLQNQEAPPSSPLLRSSLQPKLDSEHLKKEASVVGTAPRNTAASCPQLGAHQKDSKGIYRGAQFPKVPKYGSCEMKLAHDSLGIGASSGKPQRSTNVRSDTNVYFGPVSSPEPMGDNRRRGALPKIASHHQPQVDNASAMLTPMQLAQAGLHPNMSLLRTTTSLYAPTRIGYIRIAKTNTSNTTSTTTQAQTKPLSSTNSIQQDAQEDFHEHPHMQAVTAGVEQHKEPVYAHGTAIPMQGEDGDIILVNKANTDLEFYSPEAPQDANFTSPRNTPPRSPRDSGDPGTDDTVNLVVEVPGVVLNPGSPSVHGGLEDDPPAEVAPPE